MPISPRATPEKSTDSETRREFVFAGLVLGAVLIAIAAMTWQKWPDLLVDFGVQLYIPWQLAKGAVLYRDIAYLTGGPLSQYFDAAVFRIFGASVLTLVLVNLALLVALLAMVYWSFHRAAGQVTAVMAGMVVLLAFAFEHYSDYGIFNYVTPYSEEIYQGMVLAVLTVLLLCQWVATHDKRTALAAGFCLGLVFLTKAEVFLALAVTTAASFLLAWRITRKATVALQGFGLITLAGAIPPLVFLLYFLRHGTLRESFAWTCWAWTPLFTTAAADDRFYRWCLGLDAPIIHVKQMLWQFGGLVVILTVCALVFRLCRRGWRAALGWIVLAALLVKPALKFKWEECGRCLPLFCIVTLAWVCWRARKFGWRSATIFGALWTIFSLTMLAKLGFYSRIWHYGFVLAMPASLTAVYFLVRLLPDALEKLGVAPRLWRSFVGVFLAVALLELMLGSKFTYQKKTVPIAEGADRMWTYSTNDDSTGVCMAQALNWMQLNTPPNTTVATLPAGAMMNFLLRRPNPSGYLRWNPPEMSAFGQSNMTRAMEERPPDYILLLGVDNSEFGVRFFGDKPAFGQDLVQWIDGHYRPICLIGDDWKKTGAFGIKILQLTHERQETSDTNFTILH